MINWLDIVILVIVVFSAVRGGMNGFIRSVIGLVSLIVAFFAANIYYDNLAALIVEQSSIKDGLVTFFSKDLFSRFQVPTLTLPEQLSGFKDVGTYLDKLFGQSPFMTEALSVNFGDFMAQILVNVMAWIGVFLVTFIVIRLLGVVLEEVFKLPLLKTINGLTGFLVGVLRGGLIVFVIVLGLEFLGEISQSGYLSKVVDQSLFAFYILKYNIFRWIII